MQTLTAISRLTVLAFISIYVLSSAAAHAAVPKTWSKTIGGAGKDYVSDIIQTWDGQYVFTGMSTSLNTAIGCRKDCEDLWAVKLDADGKIVWERTYGGKNIDLGSGIAESGGGYALTGWLWRPPPILSNDTFKLDFTILKLDDDGWRVWEKNYKSQATIGMSFHIVPDGAGGLLAGGCQIHYDKHYIEDFDTVVIHTDGGGDNASITIYSRSQSDTSSKAFMFDDGTFVFADRLDQEKAVIVRAEPGGKEVWSREIRSGQNKSSVLLLAKSDTAIYAADNIYNSADSTRPLVVYKLDHGGSILWEKQFERGEITAHDLISTADGGAVVAGSVETPCERKKRFGADKRPAIFPGDVPSCTGAWILKIDGGGTPQWERVYGRKIKADIFTIAQTSDGGYIAGGSRKQAAGLALPGCFDADCNDAWIIKLDENGNCRHCN